MPSPPSSRSASPVRITDLPTVGHRVPIRTPQQSHDQGLAVLPGDGRAASTLRDGMHDTRRDIGEGAQAHLRPLAGAVRLAPLQVDSPMDDEEITVYELPPPRSRIEIERDFAVMRSAQHLFQAAADRLANSPHSGLFHGLSHSEALALAALKKKISQSGDWQAAFAILERASKRYRIESLYSLNSAGLLLSISDQIDLYRHQANLMRLFEADFTAMRRHAVPQASALTWEQNNFMVEDDWPFAETEERWSLQLTPEVTQLAPRSSPVQFWGELWSGTTRPFDVMIETNATANTLDMIAASLDLVEIPSHFKIMRSMQAMLVESADFAELAEKTLSSEEAKKAFEIFENAHARHASAHQNGGGHHCGLDFLSSEVHALERYQDELIFGLQRRLAADPRLKAAQSRLASSVVLIHHVAPDATARTHPALLHDWALRFDGQKTSITTSQSAIQFWGEFHTWSGNDANPIPARVLRPPEIEGLARH